MIEPVSNTGAAVTFASLSLLTIFPGVDVPMVLGAFSGSVIFVISSKQFTNFEKIAVLVVSFIGGCLSTELVTGIIKHFILRQAFEVSNGVGALFAGALIVKFLMWAIQTDTGKLIKDLLPWKGNGNEPPAH